MHDAKHSELLNDGLERVTDAARFLGVSRTQIYKMIDDGVLPYVTIGKTRKIPIRAVRDLAVNRLVINPPVDE